MPPLLHGGLVAGQRVQQVRQRVEARQQRGLAEARDPLRLQLRRSRALRDAAAGRAGKGGLFRWRRSDGFFTGTEGYVVEIRKEGFEVVGCGVWARPCADCQDWGLSGEPFQFPAKGRCETLAAAGTPRGAVLWADHLEALLLMLTEARLKLGLPGRGRAGCAASAAFAAFTASSRLYLQGPVLAD